MRTGVYILFKLVYTSWFLVRKDDPYYGKYKGIRTYFATEAGVRIADMRSRTLAAP
jgi:hypothetical protein